MTPAERRGVVYLVVCAAPPARDALVLVELAQQAGWEVCLIATPNARRFIDPPALEAATGHPVRFDYKQPDEPDVLPPPDAIVERAEPGGWQPGLFVGRGVDRGEQTLDGGGVRLHGAVDQDRRGGVDPAL
jgi:hypothetical protein